MPVSSPAHKGKLGGPRSVLEIRFRLVVVGVRLLGQEGHQGVTGDVDEVADDHSAELAQERVGHPAAHDGHEVGYAKEEEERVHGVVRFPKERCLVQEQHQVPRERIEADALECHGREDREQGDARLPARGLCASSGGGAAGLTDSTAARARPPDGGVEPIRPGSRRGRRTRPSVPFHSPVVRRFIVDDARSGSVYALIGFEEGWV